ncbi:hypothetical protein SLS54_009468 [Diplodia seriata]
MITFVKYSLTLNGFVFTHSSFNVGLKKPQPSLSSKMTNANCACIFLTTSSLVLPTPSTSAALLSHSSLRTGTTLNSTPKHSPTNPTTSPTPTVSPTISISLTHDPSVNAHAAATNLPTSSTSVSVTLGHPPSPSLTGNSATPLPKSHKNGSASPASNPATALSLASSSANPLPSARTFIHTPHRNLATSSPLRTQAAHTSSRPAPSASTRAAGHPKPHSLGAKRRQAGEATAAERSASWTSRMAEEGLSLRTLMTVWMSERAAAREAGEA